MLGENIPSRRHGVRVPVEFEEPTGNKFTYPVTYNIGVRVFECFISHDDKTRILKSGALLRAIIEDGCILISLLLQHGMTMKQIADALGENRPEGQKTGLPSSPLGALARVGAEIDEQINQKREK